MKVIYKYKLALTTYQHITLPYVFKVLRVQTQHGVAWVWIEFDESILNQGVAALNSYCFTIVTTGNPIELAENDEYIGTFFLDDGLFVGHVYLRK